ncbi:thioesterase family protein [Massilia sp. CF038]|uniref:thioesterase family protein n=1 Tax=Massilia sp. CF038 TaxID=1881045 RepID=UPI0009153491|nr:thioesterase family protein [Massilia sp. CF038]SHG72945.1 Acyl-CoA thioesterase FadM [Massilia sp. CF038]
MNLWFRLIWMLLTVRWRSKVSIFESAALTMTVMPTDLDFNGHVNNGRYLTLADVARMDYIVRSGTARVALALRARPIVGDAVAKFRRDLKLFQRFKVESRSLGWNARWSFLEHRFMREGRVLGVVVIRGMLVNKDGPIAPPDLARHLGVERESPAVPPWVLQWSDSCDMLSDQLRHEEAEAMKARLAAHN